MSQEHEGIGSTEATRADGADLSSALETMEEFLLGAAPSLTRVEVAQQAGVPVEVAQELWRLLGFPRAGDDEVAFTEADVEALGLTKDLVDLGIIDAASQAALVRTWGRSFARLAEWETTLLAGAAGQQGSDPAQRLTGLAEQVLPRVDRLQSYVWRRHLVSAASRLLAVDATGQAGATMAVVFADIVGFTSRSTSLSENELVAWLENFESVATGLVTDRGGRIIKTIGDEVLLVADDVVAAAEVALDLTARGADDDDDFPAVRAGVAYGDVVRRLGDVYGPTVNLASRLTSIARPGTVLLDMGAYELLSGKQDDDEGSSEDTSPYRFREMRRVSVKGYPRLRPWVLRRR